MAITSKTIQHCLSLLRSLSLFVQSSGSVLLVLFPSFDYLSFSIVTSSWNSNVMSFVCRVHIIPLLSVQKKRFSFSVPAIRHNSFERNIRMKRKRSPE
jgi:hypothetical protein